MCGDFRRENVHAVVGKEVGHGGCEGDGATHEDRGKGGDADGKGQGHGDACQKKLEDDRAMCVVCVQGLV